MNLRWILAAFLLPTLAHGQWEDVKKIGTGGETFVSADGKGHVYVTGHLPTTLFVSDDWGLNFAAKPFPGFCDVSTYVWPDGKMHLLWMTSSPWGIKTAYSTDFGKTLTDASFFGEPLDRPWLAAHPPTNRMWFLYSDGYIGYEPVPGKGFVIKGVFLAGSKDGGKSFEHLGRVDKEPDGHYGVDPYLTCGASGRLYAMWGVTSDKNTIDSFDYATSADGGKTFTNHQTLLKINKQSGDTQERWMLGTIVAVGEKKVVAVLPDYKTVTVQGKDSRAMLLQYVVSEDGGATFSEPKNALSQQENLGAVKQFENAKSTDKDSVANYAQTLAWASVDSWGRIHLAFQDNRLGQIKHENATWNQWQVRYAVMDDTSKGFGRSEAVSKPMIQVRPNLDFLGITSDKRFTYITWSQNEHDGQGFSGDLMVARKPITAPKGK